jgi:dienelactone hydrolase
MHIIYPTNPKKAVPVMALNSSSEHLAKGAATLDRPQIAGFAFNGYASVMFDFGYTPMARDDHYSLFQPVVSGDGLSYAVHFYSDKLIGTAAMRYIRYLSYTQDEFNFDTNAIGVYGNSKGGWMTYLGEENPELLKARRMFSGHHGKPDTKTIRLRTKALLMVEKSSLG